MKIDSSFIRVLLFIMQRTNQALDQPIHLYKYQDDPSIKDDLPPVKYWQLFRFSDKLDYLLLALGFACAIGNGVSLVFYANPFGQLTQAFAPNADKNLIVEETKKSVFGFLINSAIVFVNSWISQACWSISSERQTIKCRKEYFRALFRHQPAWYDHKRSTEVAEKMYTQTNHLQQSIGSKISGFIMTCSLVLSGIIISMTRGWRMAVVLISFVPVMFTAGILNSRIANKADKQANAIVQRMNGSALEVIQNIRTVKMLNSQQYQIDRYNIYLQKLSVKGLYFGCLKSVVWSVFFFCIIMNYTLGFWYGSILVSRETYNSNTGASFAVSDVIVIFFTIYTSNLSLGQIPECLSAFQLGCLSGAKIFSMIDRKPLIESGERPIPEIRDITFKDVSFRFDAPLFQNFNIKIKRGKTAFVGESGSGKSTLVNLLLRFYDPLAGGIKINENIDYKELDLLGLRASIGYVGQEPVLLGKTLREALMAEQYTDEEITEALKNAEAYNFVKQIGIDSEFGQLSGGQKQRIAIARALLKKPQVLILDEATSALDRTNQMQIQRTIDGLNVPFTIIIAHKIQTIQKADEIYVLNKGKVIEEGDYSSLFQLRGKFYELATKQIALKKEDIIVHQQQEQRSKTKEVSQEKLSSEELNSSKEEIATRFSWRYVFRLFGLNGSRNIMLIIGVICSMAIGCIFPVFSRFLSIMIVTLSGIKYATDDAKKAEFVHTAMQQSLYLLIISLSALVLVAIRGTLLNIVREKLGLCLKKTVYTKLLNMNVTYFDRTGTGFCSAVLNNDCNVINRIGSQLVSDIFENLATLVCGLTIAFVACWQMTLIALAVLPVLLLAGKLQLSLNQGFSSEADKAYKKCHQIVIDSLLNYKTVLSFNHQGHMIQKYDDLLAEPMRIAVKKGNAVGISFGIAQALISCIFALIFYIGALLIRDYNIEVLNIYTSIYAIMFTAVQAGGQLGFIPNIIEMKMFCANVFQILDNEQDLEFNPIGGSTSPIQGNIQFKNVEFQYPLRAGKVYKGLNVQIKQGQKVALVGPSGCGKSTLLQLLLKLYNIEQGQILLEGRSIEQYDIGHLRNSMSVVSQEPVLFNRSIYENIKYNQTNATYEDVVTAARMANCFDFIQQANFGVKSYANEQEVAEEQEDIIRDAEIDGFRRKAGPKGSFLSGGQKQRIAIARALVRKPKIIILDEATSALDSTNEQEVQAALDLIHGCTQIVIAHRLITIKDSDVIYAFNKGQIVEKGTFDELVKQKGYFYHLAQGKGDRS